MKLAPLHDLTEKQLTGQVVELARTLGWARYHTYRSERSEPGWPDEALLRERLVLLELKAAKGKLSDAQKRWLRALLDAGQEAYLIRPADLDDLAKILAGRITSTHATGWLRHAEKLRDQTEREVAA